MGVMAGATGGTSLGTGRFGILDCERIGEETKNLSKRLKKYGRQWIMKERETFISDGDKSYLWKLSSCHGKPFQKTVAEENGLTQKTI